MTNIYITGASGTGKTSLANALSVSLDMPVAVSVARTSPHKMGTYENQRYVSRAIMNQHVSLDNHIITRTPLDALAFTSVWRYDTHEDRVASFDFLGSNPILIYCPSYWTPEDDGFRPTNPEEQQQVDRVISEFLEFSGAKYYRALYEPVEARCKHTIEFIRKVKQDASIYL